MVLENIKLHLRKTFSKLRFPQYNNDRTFMKVTRQVGFRFLSLKLKEV